MKGRLGDIVPGFQHDPMVTAFDTCMLLSLYVQTATMVDRIALDKIFPSLLLL